MGLGVTEAYNATTGVGIWRRTFRGRGRNAFYAIATSPDGSKVFVTGGTNVGFGGGYGTMAYNATTGATLWVARYGTRVNSGTVAEGIAVSPGGSQVFVTGGTDGGGQETTVAYGS